MTPPESPTRLPRRLSPPSGGRLQLWRGSPAPQSACALSPEERRARAAGTYAGDSAPLIAPCARQVARMVLGAQGPNDPVIREARSLIVQDLDYLAQKSEPLVGQAAERQLRAPLERAQAAGPAGLSELQGTLRASAEGARATLYLARQAVAAGQSADLRLMHGPCGGLTPDVRPAPNTGAPLHTWGLSIGRSTAEALLREPTGSPRLWLAGEHLRAWRLALRSRELIGHYGTLDEVARQTGRWSALATLAALTVAVSSILGWLSAPLSGAALFLMVTAALSAAALVPLTAAAQQLKLHMGDQHLRAVRRIGGADLQGTAPGGHDDRALMAGAGALGLVVLAMAASLSGELSGLLLLISGLGLLLQAGACGAVSRLAWRASRRVPSDRELELIGWGVGELGRTMPAPTWGQRRLGGGA